MYVNGTRISLFVSFYLLTCCLLFAEQWVTVGAEQSEFVLWAEEGILQADCDTKQTWAAGVTQARENFGYTKSVIALR